LAELTNMAQTNFTPISLYYSTTAAAVPTAGNLVAGELAINTQDGKLFYKDAAGVVQTIASKDVNSGTFTNISVSGVASFADGTVSLPSITNIGDTNTGIFFPAADTIAFTEGGVESMRIDSSGNLGIGTSSPTSKLTVNATNAGYTDGIDIINTTDFGYGTSVNFRNIPTSGGSLTTVAQIQQYYQASNKYGLTFSKYNSSLAEAMRIDSDGNVGIGTSSPATRLNIADSGGGVALQFNGYTGGQNIQAKIECERPNFNNFESQLRFYTHNGSSLAEKMRIDQNGFLFLNTTTTRNSGQLSIDYNGSSAGGMGINDSASANGSTFIGFLTGGTFRGSINNAANTAVTYNTTSDYRLKENIAPMTGALAKVAQLKPCTYVWKENGLNGQGFIAHELAEVCPDAVTGEKDDVDKEGKPKYQGVDTSFLVATLTAAIQEQQALIANLTTRLTALENK